MKKIVKNCLALAFAAVVAGNNGYAQTDEITLTVGDPAPEIKAKWVKGTPVQNFTGDQLYVVEFWATWCGPCIYQLPFVDTLKRDYKGKNIEFVTLSIDYPRDRQKWRDFIRDNNLTGTQLLADNAFDSEFIKAFDISGIPRFLLIDPKGNIVSNNAPRPSDESLRKMLDGLLDN